MVSRYRFGLMATLKYHFRYRFSGCPRLMLIHLLWSAPISGRFVNSFIFHFVPSKYSNPTFIDGPNHHHSVLFCSFFHKNCFSSSYFAVFHFVRRYFSSSCRIKFVRRYFSSSYILSYKFCLTAFFFV